MAAVGAKVCAAAGDRVWVVVGGGEVDHEEDRRDRDSRLPRTSNPTVAGPRLRSS